MLCGVVFHFVWCSTNEWLAGCAESAGGPASEMVLGYSLARSLGNIFYFYHTTHTLDIHAVFFCNRKMQVNLREPRDFFCQIFFCCVCGFWGSLKYFSNITVLAQKSNFLFDAKLLMPFSLEGILALCTKFAP